MPASGGGLDVLSRGSAGGEGSYGLVCGRVVFKRLMATNPLYRAECLILVAKSLILCDLMDALPRELVKRHCIREETGFQGYVDLFQACRRLYDGLNAAKWFNWICILVCNEFFVGCGWVFELKPRLIVINVRISA